MRNKEVERGNKESHIEKKKVKLFLVRSRGYILKTFNYGLKGGAFISQLLPLLKKTEGCPMGKVQGCLPCSGYIHVTPAAPAGIQLALAQEVRSVFGVNLR